MTEDGLGTTSVKKQHEGIGYDEAGEGFEGINKEVGFEIRTGEDIVKQGGVGDDAGKVIKADDEYFEATVRPDAEGKMKDMEEFIECNMDGRYQQMISQSNTDAQMLGITGTPAFYIISNTGTVQTIQGAQPYEVFERIFNSMLEN